MKSEELKLILEKLLNLPAENEVFELKEAKNQYDFSKIGKYGQATRQEIDELLLEKLSDVLTLEQKRNKIRNLLFSMHKKDKTLEYFGSGSKSIWKLKSNP